MKERKSVGVCCSRRRLSMPAIMWNDDGSCCRGSQPLAPPLSSASTVDHMQIGQSTPVHLILDQSSFLHAMGYRILYAGPGRSEMRKQLTALAPPFRSYRQDLSAASLYWDCPPPYHPSNPLRRGRLS